MTDEPFEPRILAFCCYNSTYGAADTAGSMKLEYPANVKIIRLPCSGKLDVLHLLRAFEEGVDGAYVVGCEVGNCFFVRGEARAMKRVHYAQKLLDEIGVGGERIAMYNMASSEGVKFAEVAKEMTEKIRELGPSPVNKKRGVKA